MPETTSNAKPALQILYRDESIIAVNKPSGLIVHRGLDKDPVTVADILRDDIVKAKVFAAHRLDRGTSGVLLFALNHDAARNLQKQIEAGEVQKRYIALVRGPLKEACIVEHAITKVKQKPVTFSSRQDLNQASRSTPRFNNK